MNYADLVKMKNDGPGVLDLQGWGILQQEIEPPRDQEDRDPASAEDSSSKVQDSSRRDEQPSNCILKKQQLQKREAINN